MDDGHVAGWPSLENWAGWLTSLFSLLIPNYLDTSRQPTAWSSSTREREGKGHHVYYQFMSLKIPFFLAPLESGSIRFADAMYRVPTHPAESPCGE